MNAAAATETTCTGACPTSAGPSPLQSPKNPWPGTCGSGPLKGTSSPLLACSLWCLDTDAAAAAAFALQLHTQVPAPLVLTPAHFKVLTTPGPALVALAH
jgi:hypothetical protein